MGTGVIVGVASDGRANAGGIDGVVNICEIQFGKSSHPIQPRRSISAPARRTRIKPRITKKATKRSLVFFGLVGLTAFLGGELRGVPCFEPGASGIPHEGQAWA